MMSISHLSSVSRSSLFAILDGHGGSRASTFCATHLPNILTKLAVQRELFSSLQNSGHLFVDKSVESLEKGMKKVMTDMYKSADTSFLNEARSQLVYPYISSRSFLYVQQASLERWNDSYNFVSAQ